VAQAQLANADRVALAVPVPCDDLAAYAVALADAHGDGTERSA
jgi:hypothetical protein